MSLGASPIILLVPPNVKFPVISRLSLILTLLLIFASDVASNVRSSATESIVFPENLTLPVCTLLTSRVVTSDPLCIIIFVNPAVSTSSTLKLDSPVSKSTKKLSPTLNAPV